MIFGVNKEAQDYEGRTALHRTAHNGHDSTGRLLIRKFGVNIEAKDNEGMTALHRAAIVGHNTMVRLLLELGADGTKCRQHHLMTRLGYQGTATTESTKRFSLVPRMTLNTPVVYSGTEPRCSREGRNRGNMM
jgi:ankyrin repeat protein